MNYDVKWKERNFKEKNIAFPYAFNAASDENFEKSRALLYE